MSEANGREHSPEFRRGRSGAGTEAARDAAGAEDPRRRGGSQGHRPVRGAARVRQLVVAVAGREGCGVRGLHKPRNGEADAKKKRLFLQKESPVLGTRKRSSWREWNKCLKSNLTTRSVRWSAWTSSRCSKETRVRRYRGSDASTTSTSGRAPPSCSARPCPPGAGDGPQAQDEGGLGRRGRQPAGRPLRGLRAPSCATTSTPTRRERSTKRPARARELVKRACYTPKHGSWLNIAENELRTRQCLRHRRLGDTLQAEAWSVDVNERQRGVDWES